VRGREFAATLREIPLNLRDEDLPSHAHRIVSCIENLYQERAGVSPINVQHVQRAMFVSGFSKRVVQCVLGICVRFPELFHIWIGDDIQTCIVLAWRPLEAEHLMPTQLSTCKYDVEVLQELASWVIENASNLSATPDGIVVVPTIPVAPPLEAQSQAYFNEEEKEVLPHKETSETITMDKGRINQLAKAGITTLMIRNIPKHMNSQRLEQELIRGGYAGQYDFVHAPRNLNTGTSVGYAFINFKTSWAVRNFAESWHGSSHLSQGSGDKSIDVSIAEQQGLAANSKRWSNSKVMRLRNPALRPIIRDPSWTAEGVEAAGTVPLEATPGLDDMAQDAETLQ